jgi:hypothetical protein
MILFYRILPEGSVARDRNHPDKTLQQVLMHRTSSRIIAAVDAF